MIESSFFLAFLLFDTLCRVRFEDQKTSRFVLAILLLSVLFISTVSNYSLIGWLVFILLIDMYVLFYGIEVTKWGQAVIKQLFLFAFLVFLLLFKLLPFSLFPLLYGEGMYLLFCADKHRFAHRGYWLYPILAILLVIEGKSHPYLATLIALICLCFIEMTSSSLNKEYTRTTAEFQNQVMTHHYEEVKAVYLNMRGWRHDYHNHIQSLKAYLSMKQYPQMEQYLNELEHDLNQVDQLVKSGNLMVDAILNSKLSLAKQTHIAMNCKVNVPSKLPISDVDLCVLIGNLMDNAIEACAQVEASKRMLRVYMDIVHCQLYLSITNSAKEDASFNQRQYISEKRGNHGHGMKRVKLTVDKYDGYLNLKNEPGVFVSEVMLPMDLSNVS